MDDLFKYIGEVLNPVAQAAKLHAMGIDSCIPAARKVEDTEALDISEPTPAVSPITDSIIGKLARYIEENVDEDGYFKADNLEFWEGKGEPIYFDISCLLYYRKSRELEGEMNFCVGVHFYLCQAYTVDEDGNEYIMPFDEKDLKYSLID